MYWKKNRWLPRDKNTMKKSSSNDRAVKNKEKKTWIEANDYTKHDSAREPQPSFKNDASHGSCKFVISLSSVSLHDIHSSIP